jgi:hypothetical protein
MIKYKAGYKYQLVEGDSWQTDIIPEQPIDEPFYSLDMNGLLTAKPGYAWDGPSGPTIDTHTFMRGSLFHDICYQMMREGLISRNGNRTKSDKLLREVCLFDGMWKVRAWWVYKGVRKGAERSSIVGRPILTAPKRRVAI